MLWATASALVLGLSPPALLAATSVSPEGACAALLTAAALAALSVRERYRKRTALTAATCVAVVPWLWIGAILPAAIIALALARWLRRRRRSVAGFITLEVVLTSAVVFITFHDRVFGGPWPYSSSAAPGGGLGTSSVLDVLERAPRLVGVWLDRGDGLVRWAPFAIMALGALVLLWRSRRDRLAEALPERVDVEVAVSLLALCCAAQVFAAALLAPALSGAWSPARLMLCVAPLAAGLCAWGWQRFRRPARGLAAVTLAAGAWTLIGGRFFDGSLPWGGAERLLPVFPAGGALSAGAAAACAVAAVAIGVLVVRERDALDPLA